MLISVKAIVSSTFGVLLLLSVLSNTPSVYAETLALTSQRSPTKRALLGSLIPIEGVAAPSKDNGSSPAPEPAVPASDPPATTPPQTSSPPPPPPPVAPTPEKKDPVPVSQPTSPPKPQSGSGNNDQSSSDSDSTKHDSQSTSSTSSSSSPATPSTERKKKPSQSSGSSSDNSKNDDDSSSSGGKSSSSSSGSDQDQDSSSTNSANSNISATNAPTTPKEGLSSGIVAMIVLVVLAVVAAVLLSCYRIRQSRIRRKEREDCWDENILKNHVGPVGYNGINGMNSPNGGVGSIDVKSEALGDGGIPAAAVEAAYAGRGSMGGTSLRDNGVNSSNNVYGGNYSPYTQHAHAYYHGHSQQQQGYGGVYGGAYY
ncbi:hypothetical protein FBU30_007093 [Linnemannia zychae]|nr:hypothetical protein FBU30_007093 [Linnemannia zychae]